MDVKVFFVAMLHVKL